MRSAILATLGAASMAMAQYTNSTGPSVSVVAGDYKFFACVILPVNISSFVKVASSPFMSIDLCAASCRTKYMATINDNCLCADDSTGTVKVETTICDAPCPGNKAQSCGSSISLRRRMAGPLGSLVSLYERQAAAEAPGSPTVTLTVTATQVQTVTSCPPTVTDCPIGSEITNVWTYPTTQCETSEEWLEWHKKKIVCYNGHCGPEIPCKKGDKKHRVICRDDHCRTEVCDTDEWNKLVICKGPYCKYADCKSDDGQVCHEKKIVCWNGKCTYEKCIGSECDKRFVCKGHECRHEQCDGEDCHEKIVCDGDGEHCKPAPPPPGPPPPPSPCNGDNCKLPIPPSPPGQVCNGGDSCRFAPCHGEGCRIIQFLATGTMPNPQPTSPPLMAGAGNLAVNILGAAAGLIFVL